MKYILSIPEESDCMYYCDDLEIQAIARVLKSKKLFRYQGKDVETECSLFEKKFAAYLNSHKTILLSSGTNALVNALYSLDIQEGDEVLIPAYTFYATAAAVLELKAVPVIVNVNHFLSFDPIDLENKITNKTKAVIAVHMDGYSCDMDYLLKFCDHHDLVLIEDCAQAIGGSYLSKKLGTLGQAGCFSFNMDKVISCGEGGSLVLPSEALYQKAFLYHDTCNQFGPTNKEMYTIPKFSGKSMRVSEIQGAMINVQLDRLPTILAELKIRKKMLDEHLVSIGLELIPSYDEEGECFTTSRVLCADVTLTNKIILDLNKQNIKANSPMLRPAHHVWQWHHLLPQYPVQSKFGFLPSIDMLSRVLLLHVTLDGTLEEWQNTIRMIRVV